MTTDWTDGRTDGSGPTGGALEGSDVFVGAKAEEHRGALLLTYPMQVSYQLD